jgi:hypothetical protein
MIRKRLFFVQILIEREESDLVPPLGEIGDHVLDHLARKGQPGTHHHAAARVHQEGQRKRARPVDLKIENSAAFAFVEHLEVCGRQCTDRPTLAIVNDGADRHQIHRGFEGRKRRLLGANGRSEAHDRSHAQRRND